MADRLCRRSRGQWRARLAAILKPAGRVRALGGGAGASAMLAALCGPFPGKEKPAG